MAQNAAFRIVILPCIGIAMMLTQCAGTRPGAGYSDDTPDEIRQLIRNQYKNSLCAVGTANAGDESMARTKAAMLARSEIARQFKAQIDALQKGYEEAVSGGGAQEYSQVMEVFASLQLDGSTIAKSMIRKERSGQYSAKVLVVIAAEQVKALVDDRLRSYTSFKASEAYKQLEERARLEREARAGDNG
jgi:hypothetical protein